MKKKIHKLSIKHLEKGVTRECKVIDNLIYKCQLTDSNRSLEKILTLGSIELNKKIKEGDGLH